SLQRERLREVKILDNLQKDIPEKVWLERLEFKDTNLMISGKAISDGELTNFMENLSKSVFLKEVNLLKSSELSTDRGMLKQFEIVCVIDRPILSSSEVRR
ncbi:MAG: PilN domain-containing protein, partial [Pseudobdellovibrionaceae bacterium]